MQADIRRVGDILAGSEDVLILTHKNPDGDCLGTGVALCRYLLSLGKRATVVNADPIPSKFDYLFEGLPQETFEPKCIISVDVADPKLLGPLEDLADRVDLCIDHHISNTLYAKETHLCPDDGAAALSLYRIFRELGVAIDAAMAKLQRQCGVLPCRGRPHRTGGGQRMDQCENVRDQAPRTVPGPVGRVRGPSDVL